VRIGGTGAAAGCRATGCSRPEPRTARNRALLHFAEHLPAAVLADLLGPHLTTAEKWSTAAGRRWLTYAGDR